MNKDSNWNELWNNLKYIFELGGDNRVLAVLNNHKNYKEKICRKFGVVCNSDIYRIQKEVKNEKR